MEDRIKIAIMNWDDQFDIAMAVIDVVNEWPGIELTEEQCDEIVDCVLALTDDYSTGDSHLD